MRDISGNIGFQGSTISKLVRGKTLQMGTNIMERQRQTERERDGERERALNT